MTWLIFILSNLIIFFFSFSRGGGIHPLLSLRVYLRLRRVLYSVRQCSGNYFFHYFRFTLIFLRAQIVSVTRWALGRRAGSRYRCSEIIYELCVCENVVHSPAAAFSLHMHIDEMPSIFFFIHPEHIPRIPRIIHDILPTPSRVGPHDPNGNSFRVSGKQQRCSNTSLTLILRIIIIKIKKKRTYRIYWFGVRGVKKKKQKNVYNNAGIRIGGAEGNPNLPTGSDGNAYRLCIDAYRYRRHRRRIDLLKNYERRRCPSSYQFMAFSFAFSPSVWSRLSEIAHLLYPRTMCCTHNSPDTCISFNFTRSMLYCRNTCI